MEPLRSCSGFRQPSPLTGICRQVTPPYSSASRASLEGNGAASGPNGVDTTDKTGSPRIMKRSPSHVDSDSSCIGGASFSPTVAEHLRKLIECLDSEHQQFQAREQMLHRTISAMNSEIVDLQRLLQNGASSDFSLSTRGREHDGVDGEAANGEDASRLCDGQDASRLCDETMDKSPFVRTPGKQLSLTSQQSQQSGLGSRALAMTGALLQAEPKSNPQLYVLNPVWTSKCKEAELNVEDDDAGAVIAEAIYEMEDDISSRRGCIWSPHSKWRIAWDIVGIIVLFYDLVMIPIQLSFPDANLMHIPVLFVIGLSTLLYWTADVVTSFFVGFQDKRGVLILDWRRVVAHYIKTWFVLDFLIVTIDWAAMLMDGTFSEVEAAGMMRMGKSLRMLRILRTLRLLRLVKLRQLLGAIQDRVDSEYLSMVINITKYVAFIVAINHLVACAWCALGSIDAYGQQTWLKSADMEGTSLTYRYATALHWSLTQFTPASMSVQPQNVSERIFAVIILLLALIVFSSFLSSITSAMTSLRNLGSNEEKQAWLLRKFFRQHHVSRDLTARIVHFVGIITTLNHEQLQESNVRYLQLLSGPLRQELAAELWLPRISVHPLFKELGGRNTDCMGKVCNLALSSLRLGRRDVLFLSDQECSFLYIITRGLMMYNHKGGELATRNLIKAHPNCEYAPWFCEASLWTKWIHRGRMVAGIESELITLDSSKFSEIISKFPSMFGVCRHYGTLFVTNLNEQCKEDTPCDILRQDKVLRVNLFGIRRPQTSSIDSHSFSRVQSVASTASVASVESQRTSGKMPDEQQQHPTPTGTMEMKMIPL